jgi:hypothetical protein
MTATDNSTGESTITYRVTQATGAFPDGAYQTKVYLNDTLVALLNWSVSE